MAVTCFFASTHLCKYQVGRKILPCEGGAGTKCTADDVSGICQLMVLELSMSSCGSMRFPGLHTWVQNTHANLQSLEVDFANCGYHTDDISASLVAGR
jgi:hypothetical protein